MGKDFKNPILRRNNNENHPSGNLLEEIREQDMSEIAGGTTDAVSAAIARSVGLGNNFGKYCTWSAECAGTVSCGK
ncbi:plantaricin C family lantibiotic [Bacillus sp. NSP9.1]|uniref:plantaricin C family lantibiotic n=1 Tax=Bacillus sp. NSP9.1 TaxID=1071078 RepID=UPI00047EA9F9|nr:plantaricin C family lantibiotic [Bacillus sp. NSP9.1]QHZ48134.1 plantaricin C family lantibiotic [Bacillus sp. NSP9.1]